MNELRCPKCNLVNMMSATVCHRCQTSLVNLSPPAEVSVPIEETFQAQEFAQQNQPIAFNNQSKIPRDNELGRKTYFWYRVYLAGMMGLNILLIIFGLFVSYVSQFESGSQAEENVLVGIIYAVLGGIFALIFAIGLFLPRKSWNWVVGIVYISLSFMSCCLILPATIPLLIFWLKSETQVYMGRK